MGNLILYWWSINPMHGPTTLPKFRQCVNYNWSYILVFSYRHHPGGALWRSSEAETQQDGVHQPTAERPREDLLQDALPWCRHEGASRHDDQSTRGQNPGKTPVYCPSTSTTDGFNLSVSSVSLSVKFLETDVVLQTSCDFNESRSVLKENPNQSSSLIILI